MKQPLHRLPRYAAFLFFVLISLLFACNNKADTDAGDNGADGAPLDSATEAQKHLPENALKTLTIAEGLTVTPFATEPMLINPTNIDVDERGRVWVTEAYNYRPGINGNPTNPQGDRIVILTDTNGDGRADSSKIFYQGPEVNAPLGVCVLGNKVIVSQSPYVWAFYDDNGDDKADRKEIMFQGISGEQHDHGVHSFTFGPDGKLYFNFGNEGQTLKDKAGKVVLDQDGDEIGPKKYKMGMVFRCDPDGTNVECLGQNFRNNYEAAVDSYGTIWQSDNDDDGNRGVRINYVMPYGNYGYTDEMTGAGWRASRTNMEDSIPLQHWHLNDPGVVPNLLQTGAGSPTGMIIYEGSLLPAAFQNGMIHCDAGPNVVRAYPVKKAGAGYTAEIVNLLKNEKDQWFRPADICVAPDGSLIVADWYDPGVGGHAAGDQQRGRIYRLAPADAKYTIPKFDYNTPAGAVQALQNPNLAVRHHAWTALQAMDDAAKPELEKLWKTSDNPRMRARAFWALVKNTGDTAYISQAIADNNADIRITGLRAAAQRFQGRTYTNRQTGRNPATAGQPRNQQTDSSFLAAPYPKTNSVTHFISQLVNDKDPQVRRECALILHHNQGPEAAALWAQLAMQHDGKDRWYLEALGIGADSQWDAFFSTFLTYVQNKPLENEGYRDVVWRARTDKAVPYLAQLAGNGAEKLKDRLRYFRAFDFNAGPAKRQLLLNMIAANRTGDTALNNVVLRHLDMAAVKASPPAQKALNDLVRATAGTPPYLEMVERYEMKSENPALLQLAIDKRGEPLGRNAARLLLKMGGMPLAQGVLNGRDTARAYGLTRSLGGVGSKPALDLLQTVMLSTKYDTALRRRAAYAFGRSGAGEDRALELLRTKKVPAQLLEPLVSSVSGAWRGSVRSEAATYMPGAAKTTDAAMPTLKEMLALQANAVNGKAVYGRLCGTCHQVGAEGYDFGPKLTEIGAKLPKEGLLESILYPSAGLSFGYETWVLTMKDGSTQTGIIGSKTETDIELKLPGGNKIPIKRSEVKTMKQLKESMMPANLHQSMSKQELADLLEYLAGLKKKA